MMENKTKNTFLRLNTLFGALMGLAFVIISWAYHKAGQLTNPSLNNMVMLLCIAGMFIGVREYREKVLGGIITYGRALGACVYQTSVAAFILGVYTYLLYRNNPDLLQNYIELARTAMEQVYGSGQLLDNMKALLDAIVTPGFIAVSEVIGKIFSGFIFALLLAAMLKKKPIQ